MSEPEERATATGRRMRYELFRVKVQTLPQRTLDSILQGDKGRPEILRDAIDSMPSASFRKGTDWHIGNVEFLEPDGLYFRIGRTARSHKTEYREGNFVDYSLEEAPYSHVVLDLATGVIAIQENARIAKAVIIIAENLGRILNRSGYANESAVHFSVAPIVDPENFVTQLRAAHKIKAFGFTFTRPNPPGPPQWYRLIQAETETVDAERGSAGFKGESLKPEPLAELTEALSAIGENATAKLIQEEGGPVVTRDLRKSSALTVMSDDLHAGDALLGEKIKREVLAEARQRFNALSKHLNQLDG